MVKSAGLIGTAPEASARVKMKVHGVVSGGGYRPSMVSDGPTMVAMTCPSGTLTLIVSPSIPSWGSAALASTPRWTASVDFGSHEGRAPYFGSADPQADNPAVMAVSEQTNSHACRRRPLSGGCLFGC